MCAAPPPDANSWPAACAQPRATTFVETAAGQSLEPPLDPRAELPDESAEGTVHTVASQGAIVDSDCVGGPIYPELEALATLPLEIGFVLGEWCQGRRPGPGDRLPVQGPHGPIEVVLPAGARPGASLKLRLAPTPEFRVRVPPGAEPGSAIHFARDDGVEVSVAVPEGVQPGQVFTVLPPALMVRVPEGAEPGDALVFRCPPPMAGWRRARVPAGMRPGGYFAARIPPGGDAQRYI